jgi:NADH-quinone oxidoreductase subunit G
MSDQVTLTIDGIEITVPKGTLVVDAAKRLNIDIPVFCYHPKMEPVGMCRMCLVEIGMPLRDRGTGELVLNEDGSPQIRFSPNLQTGCTVAVAPGMVVRTNTEPVDDAREAVIEFILTSHPLDCPICDKGGECPLQNLTMEHGRGETRFDFTDKMKLQKHVPLGELIYLDRERCIQCARCVRFQDEIVDDPVLAFHNRGRALEIVTLSEPGFDSHWSGNTTDICPVGALTTADFRFGARPWELTPVASVCNHCPVGCNTTLSTRREAITDGRVVIKRIMPRQNERVNEIWICDKGRFVHHFSDHPERLKLPLVRKNGALVEVSWQEALDLVAGRLQQHKANVAGLASDRLSNEDLFLFRKVFEEGLGSANVALAEARMAGGDVVAAVGISSGSDLQQLGAGDAILVVASDLHEEAPVWWLRVKQAAQRGATVVVMNARATRLDRWAQHVLHYGPGQAVAQVRQLVNEAKLIDAPAGDGMAQAAKAVAGARNLVAFYGAEGLAYNETAAIAAMLGNLLVLRNGSEGPHAGKPNNGLIPVWPRGNTQGAWDMGLAPAPGLGSDAIYAGVRSGDISALFVLGADPVGDGLMEDRGQLGFMVVQELFLTETAQLADVVLPAQSWAEREGTYTSGERRVQRFYPAIPVFGDSRPDWQILSQIGERLGMGKPKFAASLVFKQIAEAVPAYAGMDYRTLAQSEPQWPAVGRDDLYYGGTVYQNDTGVGQQWAAAAESGAVAPFSVPEVAADTGDGLKFVQARVLFRPGTLIGKSAVLANRLAETEVRLHPTDAAALAIADGETVAVRADGRLFSAQARVNEDAAPGVAVTRGLPYQAATLQLEKMKEAA